MQKIDDLREILTAIQDIGNAWHKEIIQLRKDRDDLLDENEHLRETCDRLTKQNNSLRQDIKNLRDELIKELAADKQEDFQKFVRDYLRELRKASSTPTPKAEEQTSTPSNKPY